MTPTPYKGLYLVSAAGGGRPQSFLDPPNGELFDAAPLYDLPTLDLTRTPGLVIDMHADQCFLAEQAGLVEAYLAGGGSILFNGHIAYPVFDGCAPFVPLASRGIDDLNIAPLADHPVLSGLDIPALGIRKGVRGFYGRGHNPMPPGARAITGIGPDRLPVDWALDRPDGGRLFVHGGNDLWATPERDADTARIVRNVWCWFADSPALAETGP